MLLSLSMAEINSLLGSYLWVFFRIGGMFSIMPILGVKIVSSKVRVALALMVTILVTPLVPAAPQVTFFSLEMIIITGQQIIIGVAFGFVMKVIFEIFIVGGQLYARQTGLGFATLVDPQSGMNVPLVSQLYMMLAAILFLSMNGHLLMIQGLVESFHTIPISTVGLSQATLWQLVALSKWLFAGALSIALPGTIALLIVYISFGVMNRAAPQLNVFSVGFVITLILGSIVLVVTLPFIVQHIERYIVFGFEQLGQFQRGSI